MAACVCRVMPNPFFEPSGPVLKQFFPKEKCQELLPECKCSEKFLKVVVLACQNVSDFEAFDHILSKGSVFEVNTTFDVTLSGDTVLSKGFHC
ncbi:hypothetical protein CDAR_94171 [Caerostris darwini]|uniref:Uncharacterized protein n=1 Tax=Caerostris darwini TaxID=1538125 RepID=A0AAV4NMU1_9ARAC|nr:hypothetical protein CDAR_94171 [Caerostris darwini]